MQHYRVFQVLVSSTSCIRVSDTVSWHPSTVADLPLMCPVDRLCDTVDSSAAVVNTYGQGAPTTRSEAEHPVLG